jgi:hypothetical protein
MELFRFQWSNARVQLPPIKRHIFGGINVFCYFFFIFFVPRTLIFNCLSLREKTKKLK